MPQRKSKKSGRSSYDRPIAYDSEICIEICAELLLGKKLQEICSKPPMPVGQVFLGWVQDHREAREIYRSAQNFQSDRRLAKELNVSLAVSVREWKDQVGANIQRGWRADWVERKYIPPDWSKVFPLVGGPPVDTENMQAYSELLNAYTEMLEPRDVLELGWVKEVTDAASEAQSVTAFDYGALRARSKNYQRVDRTLMRAIKRRDNALRQIEKWRKGLGAKPRRLPDHLVDERLLARRYGGEPPPAEAYSDAISAGTAEPAARRAPSPEPTRPFAPQAEAAKAAPPLAATGVGAIAAAPVVDPAGETTGATALAVHRTGEPADAGPPFAAAGETAEASPPFATAAIAAEAAPPLAATGGGAIAAAPAVDPAGETTGAAPLAVHRTGETAEAGPPFATAAEAAEAAPPLAATGVGAIAAAPVVDPAGETAGATALAVQRTGEPAHAGPPFAVAGETAEAAPPLAATERPRSCAPAPARSLPEGAEALASLAPEADAAQASPPIHAPTDESNITLRAGPNPDAPQGKLDARRAVRNANQHV